MVGMDHDSNAPLTKGDFDEAMQIIVRSFEKVATKDDIQRLEHRMDGFDTRMEGFDERLARVERVQEHMENILQKTSR